MMTKHAAMLVALVTGLAGCAHETERAPAVERPAVAVHLVQAVEESWPDGPVASATVEPIRRASPATVLMGRVERVFHDAGDKVAAGAALARVETREVTARLAQAESAVTAARAMERNAEQTRQRLERLHARQATTDKSVDDAVAAHEAAVASRAAAEQAVTAARMYVSYTEVRAPFAGVIVDRHVQAGDNAAPGRPLFTLEDLSRVKVASRVAETDAAALQPGGAVEVELPALSETREGEIAEVLPSADPDSRTFTVRVVLDNPGRRLRSGMFARVRLPGPPQAVVAVPTSAVLSRGALRGVFVVAEDGRARLRWITPGRERADRVAVLTGLAAGERVVVEPPAELVDGSPVEAR